MIGYIKTPPLGDFNSWTERELEAVERSIASIPYIRVRYMADTTYTLTKGDIDYLILTSSGSAVTITLPLSLTPSNGAAIHIAQHGAGQVTVSPEANVNLRYRLTAKTAGQYAVISLMRADPNNNENQWYLFGDMAAS